MKVDGKTIPNPNLITPPKVGDKVMISSGDFAGLIGEVVELSKEVSNLITKVKVVMEDKRVEYVETKTVILEAWQVVEKIVQSNIFQKFWGWLKGLFRKKGKKA